MLSAIEARTTSRVDAVKSSGSGRDETPNLRTSEEIFDPFELISKLKAQLVAIPVEVSDRVTNSTVLSLWNKPDARRIYLTRPITFFPEGPHDLRVDMQIHGLLTQINHRAREVAACEVAVQALTTQDRFPGLSHQILPLKLKALVGRADIFLLNKQIEALENTHPSQMLPTGIVRAIKDEILELQARGHQITDSLVRKTINNYAALVDRQIFPSEKPPKIRKNVHPPTTTNDRGRTKVITGGGDLSSKSLQSTAVNFEVYSILPAASATLIAAILLPKLTACAPIPNQLPIITVSPSGIDTQPKVTEVVEDSGSRGEAGTEGSGAENQTPESLKEAVLDALKVWQKKGEIGYGENLVLDVENSEFNINKALAFPSSDGVNIDPDTQFMVASNSVIEVQDGESSLNERFWFVQSDKEGVKTFILSPLSENEDPRVKGGTIVYALARLVDGEAEETGAKLIVEGRGTEKEPSLILEKADGTQIRLLEVVQNGEPEPTPTAPVGLIELLSAASRAKAAGPEEIQSDEQILTAVGVPNPADYGLNSEIQLYPSKVIRTEGAESNPAYILFSSIVAVGQEIRDRVFLSLDLETGIMEHVIYIEYEGVPLLIITGNSIVEKYQSWFILDSDNPQAEEWLGESFFRGLSFTYRGKLYRDDNPANGTYMPSLKEIPGYEEYVNNIFDLSKSQRQEISTHIMREFIKAIKEARSTQTPIEMNLRDKSRQIYDPSKDTLVIKVIVDNTIDEGERSGPSWNGILSIPSERKGSLLKIFYFKQTLLYERRETGSSIITFFRYFFGGKYLGDLITTPGTGIPGGDMTGPILTAACGLGNIPDALEDFHPHIYPLYDTAEIAPAPQCAVQLGR